VKLTKTAFLLSSLALCLATPSCAGNVVGTGNGGSTTSTSTGTGSTGAGITDTPTTTGTPCDQCGPDELCTYPGDWCSSPLECLPCSPSSGPVCDASGEEYASQCDALHAGKGFGIPCPPPGKVLCSGSPPAFCDPSTEMCEPGAPEDECGNVSAGFCAPLYVDGGAPDGG
jgi:hypothetical protein